MTATKKNWKFRGKMVVDFISPFCHGFVKFKSLFFWQFRSTLKQWCVQAHEYLYHLKQAVAGASMVSVFMSRNVYATTFQIVPRLLCWPAPSAGLFNPNVIRLFMLNLGALFNGPSPILLYVFLCLYCILFYRNGVCIFKVLCHSPFLIVYIALVGIG